MHPKAAKEATTEAKPKFYPAEDVSKPLKRSFARRQTKLRSSISPGTVLILLAGRFAGKRVVCLGQLPSGLLLVTGPFKLNGVPVRRVNQAYVIATSASVDVSKVDVSKFDDSYFKGEKKQRTKRSEEAFFEDKLEKNTIPAERIADQKAVDSAILSAVDADMKSYLSTRFSLKNGDRPHLMKF